MAESFPILSFTVQDVVYGIPVDVVVQVVPVVAITSLAGAPDVLLGVINVRGEIVPVISMRSLLGFAGQSLRLTDRLIIVTLHDQMVALLVDVIGEVHHVAGESISEFVADDSRERATMTIEDDGFMQVIDIDGMLTRRMPNGLMMTGSRVPSLHG